MSPDELAAELGISAKTLRAWLRRTFPRPAAEKGSSWTLTPEHIAAARAWQAGTTAPSPRTAQRRAPSPASQRSGPPEIRWDARFEESFRDQNFGGFVALGDAVGDRQAFLRERDLGLPGVYAVFAPIDWTPHWKTRGRLANVITPWPLARLRERWIEGVELVYIGCAGATSSSRTLGERISDLLKHAAGHITSTGPHKGGERLWQCTGWQSFTLVWKATGAYPEPHDLEVAIGRRFQQQTGQLPFANVRL